MYGATFYLQPPHGTKVDIIEKMKIPKESPKRKIENIAGSVCSWTVHSSKNYRSRPLAPAKAEINI
jgi:hypothetical protein